MLAFDRGEMESSIQHHALYVMPFYFFGDRRSLPRFIVTHRYSSARAGLTPSVNSPPCLTINRFISNHSIGVRYPLRYSTWTRAVTTRIQYAFKKIRSFAESMRHTRAQGYSGAMQASRTKHRGDFKKKTPGHRKDGPVLLVFSRF